MEITEKFKSAVRLFQRGDAKASLEVCREIIESQPDDTDALMLLGLLHHQRHEYEIAVHYFERAVTCDPDNAYTFFYLGNTYQAEGDIEKASACFQKAIDINPSFGDAYYNLAIILEKQDEPEKAFISYKKALALRPDHADVYNNIGNLLLKMKRFDEAVPYLRNAVQIDPSYVLAFNNLAMALKGQGYPDEAMRYFQKAIEIDPSFADLYFNLAIVLKEKGEVDEALGYFQKAIEINPSFADAYCGLAHIHEESGMLSEALSYYQKALEITPEDAETHWNMSLALLSTGDFGKGWGEYEWRFEVKDFRQRSYPSCPVPRWDGSSPEDKNIFIFAEQGVGEEIMFASCLPEVIVRASQSVVECDERLAPLFTRSFPKARVISHPPVLDDFSADISTIPMKTAMGSLPLFFRRNLASFPQYNAYLIPDASKVALWHGRFDSLGQGLKIGISWRGGSIAAEKRLRSTVLDQWSSLFSIPGVHFINLQYGDCSQELREARKKLRVTIHHWEDADPLKDLDGFAAQVAALDLAISVDNATVHIAGALGTPVWTLLPFACDWRWMRDFEDTPWYKTMRLFRQNSPGDWNGAFESVASNLRQYAETGIMPEVIAAHSYRYKMLQGPAT